MTQQTLSPIERAFKQIAVAIFGLGKKLGEPTELKTENKTSLVEAINELHDRPSGSQGVDETRTTELIDQRLAAITNGASSAFDTLKEIEDHLTQGNSATQAVLAEIANCKAKLTACEQGIAQLKTYTGYSQGERLEILIHQALTTGV